LKIPSELLKPIAAYLPRILSQNPAIQQGLLGLDASPHATRPSFKLDFSECIQEGFYLEASLDDYQAVVSSVRIQFGANHDEYFSNCNCERREANCEHIIQFVSALSHQIKSLGITQEDVGENPIRRWIQDVQQASALRRDQNTSDDQLGQARLLYILTVHANTLKLTLTRSTLLKNGGYSRNGKNLNFESIRYLHHDVDYLSSLDQRIIRLLGAFDVKQDLFNFLTLNGEDWPHVLEAILKTKRCFMNEVSAFPLRWGKTVSVKMKWKEDGDHYQPVLEPDPPNLCHLDAKLLWLDVENSEVGWVTSTETSSMLVAWQKGPPVPITDLVISEPEFKKLGLDVPQQAVSELEIVQLKDPKTVIHFSRRESAGDYGAEMEPVFYAVPEVIYDSKKFNLLGDAPLRVKLSEDPPVYLDRDVEAESELIQQLEDVGLCLLASDPHLGNKPIDAFVPMDDDQDVDDNWTRTCLDIIPDLEEFGWEVQLEPGLESILIQTNEEDWGATLSQGNTGIDWFRLDLGVEIGGQRFELVPILQALLKKGELLPEVDGDKPRRVQLEDGRYLMVPAKIVSLAMRFLLDLFGGNKKKGLEIPSLEAASLLAEHGGLVTASESAQRAVKLSERLKKFAGIKPLSPPKGLQAELRDYQIEGYSWLQFLSEYGLHGILADDMGLGKTVQALAHLLKQKSVSDAGSSSPSLVVAPTSVLPNWEAEVRKFTPQLKVLRLHGTLRAQYFETLEDYDLVITSYPLLQRDIAVHKEIGWHVVVLDEAQAIKNPKAKVTQAAAKLQAEHRICLSGTPLENHLGELWSLVNFLMPSYLGSADAFRKLFRNPIEKSGSIERQQILAQRVGPLILRRRKEDVVKELPAKTHLQQSIELHPEQQTLYEVVRSALDKRVRDAIAEKGLNRSGIIVLDAMLKLRQICCHPQLLKMESAKDIKQSAKLDRLMEMLPELIEEGRKILLFSQFTSMLAVIEKELNKAGIKYVKLTGSTKDRETPVNQFQAGEVPLFLISLKAGGTGLNLTAADTVMHYDPWWNPAAENQATDRAHRIGQEKPVFVHRFICKGSIEERIQELQKKKAGLVEGILSGKANNMKLTQADIDHLLRPISELEAKEEAK